MVAVLLALGLIAFVARWKRQQRRKEVPTRPAREDDEKFLANDPSHSKGAVAAQRHHELSTEHAVHELPTSEVIGIEVDASSNKASTR